MLQTDWQVDIESLSSVPSPGLLIDPCRVAANIDLMVNLVGGRERVSRLRPHVKTHKMPDVVRLQLAAGISRFKAATVAEAEMVAAAGGPDVLLAYPAVGPQADRLATLVDRFPTTRFATIVDDPDHAVWLAGRFSGDDPARKRRRPLDVLIDVDCGMHRTGVPLGPELTRLRQCIESQTQIRYAGLHVYDGHLHDPSVQQRHDATRSIIRDISRYDREHPSEEIVGGGSPTFTWWANETDWQCSPGTPVFWDVGYGQTHPEIQFQVAAALLTRIISRPGSDRLCLDLGYKAVASEMPLASRVEIPALHALAGDPPQWVGHSEEHVVVRTSVASQFPIGSALLAFPRHICPSVALHTHAWLMRDGVVTGERWPVTARDR